MLHEGVTPWMEQPLWHWIRHSVLLKQESSSGRRFEELNRQLVQEMALALQISVDGLGEQPTYDVESELQIEDCIESLYSSQKDLEIADYLLAHCKNADSQALEQLLFKSKSVWTVGKRSSKTALVRRIPTGVQKALDLTLESASKNAGIDLAHAWENVYGVDPDPSNAYRLAIRAVEHASIPIILPQDKNATLGKVIRQISDQEGWGLPMYREYESGASKELLLGMMRLLWRGEYDRHGGQEDVPIDVTFEEAIVAVGTATMLVHFFDASLVQKRETEQR